MGSGGEDGLFSGIGRDRRNGCMSLRKMKCPRSPAVTRRVESTRQRVPGNPPSEKAEQWPCRAAVQAWGPLLSITTWPSVPWSYCRTPGSIPLFSPHATLTRYPPFPQNIYFQERTLTCVLSFYIHIFCQKPKWAPRLDFLLPCTPVNHHLQLGSLRGCTNNSSDAQARYNYWNINLCSLESHCSVDVHENFIRCKASQLSRRVRGGKKNDRNPVLRYMYIALQISYQWVMYCPGHPIPKHQPSSDAFTCKIPPGEGFCFTFNTWQCKSHIKQRRCRTKRTKHNTHKSPRLKIRIKAVKPHSLPSIPLFQV